jgi:hypothetical protein
MPKRVAQSWLSRIAGGLTSGALALSVLGTGGSSAPVVPARPALADELDCYNDKDLYSLPECVERRELDRKSGNSQNESQGAPVFAPGPKEAGQQDPPPSEDGQSPPGGGQQTTGGGQQPSGGGQQQATNTSTQQQSPPASEDEDEDEPKPQPHVPAADPHKVVLTIEDAGKEATQYINDEGNDKYGKWARTRYERDRSNGASALGPNVMDSKVWVAKDVETAKGLYKEQSAIKNFPERKEKVEGPVEKIKPTKYGEEFSFEAGYFQDDKIWQHYRIVYRRVNLVAVVYLFGREEFFQDVKDQKWTGQGDWFTSAIYNRM